MDSWIYFFSRFTPEALILEAFIIFALISAYAAYWILKKRKYGVADAVVPAGLVKVYLSELVGDAEHLRAQLFGLLKQSGASGEQLSPSLQAQLAALSAPNAAMNPAAYAGAAAPIAGGAPDPQVAARLGELQGKLVDQGKAMEQLIQEKNQLEQALAQAKESGAGSGAGGGNDADLLAKIKALEARLAEYSVIEDDLANLKRLQQENAQLKAALASGGGSIAAVAAGAAVVEAPASPAEPEFDPVAAVLAEADVASPLTPPEPVLANGGMPADAAEQAAAADGSAQAEADSLLAALSQPDSAGVPPAPSPAPGAEPDFDSLVAEMEQTMPAGAEAAAEPPSTESAPTVDAAATEDKSDADLLAEFEKMLNS